MKGTRWTASDLATLRRLAPTGCGSREIARQLMRTRATVQTTANKHGIRIVPPPYVKPVKRSAIGPSAPHVPIVAAARPKRTFKELLAAVRAGEVTVVDKPYQPYVETHPHGTLGGVSTVYGG